ncbi:MAG: hypothetical protein N2258_04080 [Brevinematales bacterium]|nr:hypothetical protein [Brevinematales bacterium]
MTKTLRKFMSLFVAFSIFAAPVVAFSADDDFIKGKTAGEADGSKAGQSMYFWLGCLLGAIGLIIPLVSDPAVPSENLVGKSQSYIQGYTEGFKTKAKDANFKQAMNGCLVGTGISVGIYVAVLVVSLMAAPK